MIQIGITSELVQLPLLRLRRDKWIYDLTFKYLLWIAASMARKIYMRQGLGVGAFKRIYGGSKRNGSRPPHFCKSSGAVARHVLHQLQKMNIIDVDTKG